MVLSGWLRCRIRLHESGLLHALLGIAIAQTDVLAKVGLPSTPSGSCITSILPGNLLALGSLNQT